MSINLRLLLLFFALILFLITTYILKKGRIPEKYSILWYFIALVIFLVSVIPNVIIKFSNHLGFEVMSNLIIGIMLVLLTFLTMALTVIISGQKKKITLLIQEISLLKAEIKNQKKEK